MAGRIAPGGPLIIRRASPADAPELARILTAWINETPWMPRLHTPEEDVRFLSRLVENDETLVADESGRPAGFITLRDHEVPALYVRSDARRHRIGHQLIDRAKTDRDRLGLWTFQANKGARAFYKSEGFLETVTTDGADNEENLPDVYLTWSRAR